MRSGETLEQDSILAAFPAVFQMDYNLLKRMCFHKLKADYQTPTCEPASTHQTTSAFWKESSPKYIAQHRFYRRASNQLHKDSCFIIGQLATMANQQDINKMYSVKDAHNYILAANTAHYRPDIPQQCFLNEYLFP